MLAKRKPSWDEEQASPAIQSEPQRQTRVRAQRLTGFTTRVMLCTLLALAVVAWQAVLVGSGYELVKLKAQAAHLERQNETLQLEIAKLEAPQRIASIATTQLGMVMPQKVYYATTASQSVAAPSTSAVKSAVPTWGQKVQETVKSYKTEVNKGR